MVYKTKFFYFNIVLSSGAGFTLVEILVVVTIMAILTATMIPNFTSYINNQNLSQAREQIKSDLRSVQNRALTGSGFAIAPAYTHWVMRFNPNANQYIYGRVTTNTWAACNTMATDGTSTPLNSNIIVRMVPGDAGKCIFFSFSNGDASYADNGGGTNNACTTATCYISVGPPAPATVCSKVAFNSAGLVVNVANTTCN